MPMGFTTTSTLYSIEYELTIRAFLSGAKDLISKQSMHVCSWSADKCLEFMAAIENASETIIRKLPCTITISDENGGGEKRILVE